MATQESMVMVTLPANADLSASKFCFVAVGATGRVAVAGNGAFADGVLQDDPDAADKAAAVAISGIVPVRCGGVVTRGGAVASDAAGKAKNAGAEDWVLGTALDTGADGAVISVLLNTRGQNPAE